MQITQIAHVLKALVICETRGQIDELKVDVQREKENSCLNVTLTGTAPDFYQKKLAQDAVMGQPEVGLSLTNKIHVDRNPTGRTRSKVNSPLKA